MLKVQEYLRSGKRLEDLQVEHGVYSFVQNGKISLSYDQIEARSSDPISQECRGLILAEDTYEPIAVPFFRFFNKEQVDVAAPIDWNSAIFQDKLDGTLIIVYHFEGKWQVATRSRPEADVPIDQCDLTFSRLTDITVKKMFGGEFEGIDHLMQSRGAHSGKTFCFEITSPINEIVCKYNDYQLTLLGVRDLVSLTEEDPDLWAQQLGFPIPQVYHFASPSEMVEVIKNWNPLEKEGVVVRDGHFNRIKVKNPAYVAYNKLRDSLSTSFLGCIEIILLGKDDDVLQVVPEYIGDRIRLLRDAMQKLISIVEKDYQDLKHLTDMKSFALEAQQRLWPAPLYALQRRKVNSISDFLTQGKGSSVIPRTTLKTILSLCIKLNPEIAPFGMDEEE